MIEWCVRAARSQGALPVCYYYDLLYLCEQREEVLAAVPKILIEDMLTCLEIELTESLRQICQRNDRALIS